MTSFDVGYAVGQFVSTAFLPLLWLVVARFVRPIRSRPLLVASIPVAIVWVVVLGALTLPQSPLGSIAAAVVVSGYCARKYWRTKAISLPPIDPAFQALSPAAHLVTSLPESSFSSSSARKEPRRSRNSYFARHWRGDLQLGISYWINLVLIAGLLPLLFAVSLQAIGSQQWSLRTIASTYVAWLLSALGLWLWGLVGTWRSAEMHTQRGGQRVWATLAKVALILGTISTFGHVSTTYGPQLREFGLIAIGLDPMGDFKATLLTDGRSLHIDGVLREGSADEISKLLSIAPGVTTIVLSSRGGRLAEANALAAIVRKRGLNTYVETQCLSACTFIFLAGMERAATSNAKIGFHSPGFVGADQSIADASRDYARSVYTSVGLPQEFINRALTTPHDQMWFPTRDELIRAKVLTRVSFGGETSLVFSTLASKEELRMAMRQIPLLAIVESHFPDVSNKAVDEGWHTKERGGSDADITASMRSVMGEVAIFLLKHGDDQTREDFLPIALAQLQAARLVSYDACNSYLDGQLMINALPKDVLEKEEKWLISNLSRTFGSTPPRTRKTTEKAITALLSSMPPRFVPVLSEPENYRGQAIRCDAMIAFYESASKMSSSQRRAALAAMFME